MTPNSNPTGPPVKGLKPVHEQPLDLGPHGHKAVKLRIAFALGDGLRGGQHLIPGHLIDKVGISPDKAR